MLLDACVALNLLATDALGAIATGLSVRFVMVQEAADEAYYLLDVKDGQPQRTPVDLSVHTAGGALEVTALLPGELATFVRLAGQVDDGEAASLAVAVHRRLRLATDDRKARRVAAQLGLPEPARTSELLHAWAGEDPVARFEMPHRLRAVEQRARYRPAMSDPHYSWWADQVGDA